ncbi:MAG TPA: hypothetical protein VFU63_09040 [Ktedonobacterales bacterium]|nr:hypothetical protein [Ktedonobacterales bacterium]
MPDTALGSERANQAFTDLYDEQRHTFLIKYPIWVILGLSLSGVAIFALTGYLGYSPSEPLYQPWLLFLWFCALLITLQISIFRNQSLRKRLIATLVMSLLAIIFIGITYFNQSLPEILRQLLQGGRILRALAQNALTYTIVNFGLLGIFWLDTIRRWARRARGLPPNPTVDIGFGRYGGDDEMPSMQELISGDLIAAAVLALLLSFLFEPNIVSLFVHPNNVTITSCNVSWPLGTCVGAGAGPHDPPTISFLDLIQTLLYLPLGLLILALSATVSGLGALQGVDENHSQESLIMMKPENSTSTGAVASDVTETVLDTLRAALDRRIRLLLANLALAFRYIGWPVLLFLATYGVAELSTATRNYLHSPKILLNVVKYVLPGAGWGLAAVIGLVLSAALMLFRWRIVDNTMRFMGLVGFIVLLTFWIFSLALWAINQLLIMINVSDRTPFSPPSWMTGISLVLLIIFGTYFLVRRSRRPATRAQPAPVAAEAAAPNVETGMPTPEPQ